MARAYVTVLALGSGVGILAFWAFAILTDNVERFGEFGVSRAFHIGAEFTTAALLIVAGVLRLANVDQERVLTPIALGALVYAAIQSPGYYLRKTPALAWVLALTGVATIVAVAIVLAGD